MSLLSVGLAGHSIGQHRRDKRGRGHASQRQSTVSFVTHSWNTYHIPRRHHSRRFSNQRRRKPPSWCCGACLVDGLLQATKPVFNPHPHCRATTVPASRGFPRLYASDGVRRLCRSVFGWSLPNPSNTLCSMSRRFEVRNIVSILARCGRSTRLALTRFPVSYLSGLSYT